MNRRRASLSPSQIAARSKLGLFRDWKPDTVKVLHAAGPLAGGNVGLLSLWFESGEDSLSVRRFAAHEAMSSLFSISVWARSPNDDIDLESLVGKPANG